jgi:hypothetical protein
VLTEHKAAFASDPEVEANAMFLAVLRQFRLVACPLERIPSGPSEKAIGLLPIDLNLILPHWALDLLAEDRAR